MPATGYGMKWFLNCKCKEVGEGCSGRVGGKICIIIILLLYLHLNYKTFKNMETFKPIPGHTQYHISDCGKYLKRVEGGRNRTPFVTQHFHCVNGKEYPNGYMYATLLSQDGFNDLGVTSI